MFLSFSREPTALLLDENYINLKNQVIKAERRLLKELGFCVHVKHPHKVSWKIALTIKTNLFLIDDCYSPSSTRKWEESSTNADFMVRNNFWNFKWLEWYDFLN